MSSSTAGEENGNTASAWQALRITLTRAPDGPSRRCQERLPRVHDLPPGAGSPRSADVLSEWSGRSPAHRDGQPRHRAAGVDPHRLLLVRRHRRGGVPRSEEHTSELQSQSNLVCRLLLEKKKKKHERHI